ncbi:MAG: acyl-CoA reductase [Chitinophagaceae bacterium]
MQLGQRLELLTRLQDHMLNSDIQWQSAKENAFIHNAWFLPPFVDLAALNIADTLLNKTRLQQWADAYQLAEIPPASKSIGLILPGNIPLGGFYHFVCIFLAGYKQRIRLSPKDEVLIKHLVQQMAAWDASVMQYFSFEDMLKGCDAYVATIDNKISKQFEVYFGKYPSFIYRLQKSAAILKGDETRAELESLADDIFQYFGQGCMNVSKLFVPRQYDFIPLLKAFEKYNHLIDHNKYKNNYDYQLSLLILNKQFYMTNGSILLTESAAPTSPAARLNYEFYDDFAGISDKIRNSFSEQSIAGTGYRPLGQASRSVTCGSGPGTDLLQFLRDL